MATASRGGDKLPALGGSKPKKRPQSGGATLGQRAEGLIPLGAAPDQPAVTGPPPDPVLAVRSSSARGRPRHEIGLDPHSEAVASLRDEFYPPVPDNLSEDSLDQSGSGTRSPSPVEPPPPRQIWEENSDDEEPPPSFDERQVLSRFTAAAGVVTNTNTLADRDARIDAVSAHRHVTNSQQNVEHLKERKHEVRLKLERLTLQTTQLGNETTAAEKEVTRLERMVGQSRPFEQSQAKKRLEKLRLERTQLNNDVTAAEKELAEVERQLVSAQMTHAKLLPLEVAANAAMDTMTRERTAVAQLRARKEAQDGLDVDARKQQTLADERVAKQDEAAKLQAAEDAARDSRVKAQKRLQQSRKMLEAAEVELTAAREEDRSNRVAAILSLRRNTETAMADLRGANERRARVKAQREAEQEKERAALLAQGLNPSAVFRQRELDAQAEKARVAHEKRIQQHQMKIVARVMEEEQRANKRDEASRAAKDQAAHYKMQFTSGAAAARTAAYLAEHTDGSLDAHIDPNTRVHPSQVAVHSSWKHGVGRATDDMRATVRSQLDATLPPMPAHLTPPSSPEEGTAGGRVFQDENSLGARAAALPRLDMGEVEHGKRSGRSRKGPPLSARSLATATNLMTAKPEAEFTDELLKPELPGLWEEKKQEDATETRLFKYQYTKLQEETMARNREKRREQLAKTQQPGSALDAKPGFSAAPASMTFGDFVVGRSYTQRVVLTNVSYGLNTVKVLDMDAAVRDFFEVRMVPPGSMSAGMTVPVTISFTPRLNRDIETVVPFLAATGPFQIPVVCTTQKCVVSLSSTVVDFGDVVLGEVGAKTMTIQNGGAVETAFTIIIPEKAEGGPRQSPSRPTGLVSPINRLHSARSGSSRPDSHESAPSPDPGTEDGNEDEGELKVMRLGPLTPRPSGPFEIKNTTGPLAPYTSVPVTATFRPPHTGPFSETYTVTFGGKVPDMQITFKGVGAEVPIYVPEEVMDFRVCYIDTLYRNVLTVCNRGKTAHSIRMDVPDSLASCVTVDPVVGFVQPGVDFKVQIKFEATLDVLAACGEHADPRSKTLAVPVSISVKDQVLPVIFTLKAKLTTPTIKIEPPLVDFGAVPLTDSGKRAIKLTNTSCLPQRFGFTNVPAGLSVEPDFGFGTLLPNETLTRYVVFSPASATDFSAKLSLTTESNNVYSVPCKGRGFKPALSFSTSTVRFVPTPLADISIASVFVVNSTKEPQMFDFFVPQACPVTVAPLVGEVKPGCRVRVELRFNAPPDPDMDVHQVMTVRGGAATASALLATERQPALAAMLEDGDKTKRAKDKSKRDSKSPPHGTRQRRPSISGSMASLTGSAEKKRNRESVKDLREREAAEKEAAARDKEAREAREAEEAEGAVRTLSESEQKALEEAAAQAARARRQQRAFLFENRVQNWVLPCFVKGDPRPIHLALELPLVRPTLVVVSGSGRPVLEFGSVPTGKTVVRSVTIQNVSPRSAMLHGSALDPTGAFTLVNALREVESGGTHEVVIKFNPSHDGEYLENLELFTNSTRVSIMLRGTASQPQISAEPNTPIIDLGDVLAGEAATSTLTLRNTSALFAVRYTILQSRAGERNFNGINAFSLVPSEATIPPGEKMDVVITFKPDHESLMYFDDVTIDVPNKDGKHQVRLYGRGWAQAVVLNGNDKHPPVYAGDRLALSPPMVDTRRLTYSLVWRSVENPGTAELEVANLRATKVKGTGGEAEIVDLDAEAVRAGFSVETSKVALECGSRRPIKLRYQPPPETITFAALAGSDEHVVETRVTCILRGGNPFHPQTGTRHVINLRGVIPGEALTAFLAGRPVSTGGDGRVPGDTSHRSGGHTGRSSRSGRSHRGDRERGDR